jgi:predicted O-methyltransferase YrrM
MDNENKDSDRQAFIVELYAYVLKRSPSEKELQAWTDAATRLSAAEVVRRFGASAEYKLRNKVTPFFPVGHYHSPVVDPSTLGDYVESRRDPGPAGFGGINIDITAMEEFWNANVSSIFNAPFPETKTAERRFYFDGAPFPYGDALTLHAIMGHFRPKRIVEIGSGFSTACMLDSAEIHGMNDLQITCIEPYPDRLHSLLRPDDRSRVKLLERPVQEVPVQDIVAGLERNDILFIDSTHVMKTGSDVHYELFEIIPAVNPGVIIHVHDCGYPFEYPPEWVEKNYSWNEAYAIRAFLMYNLSYKIIFWGSLFKALFPEKVRQEGGMFIKNAGASLWLTRIS